MSVISFHLSSSLTIRNATKPYKAYNPHLHPIIVTTLHTVIFTSTSRKREILCYVFEQQFKVTYKKKEAMEIPITSLALVTIVVC